MENLREADYQLSYDNFIKNSYDLSLKKFINKICFHSIVLEPCVWPNFGLVSHKDSGAHKDMDYNLLIESAKSITPYFYSCFKVGCSTSVSSIEKLFAIKKIGIDAEIDMLNATKNVNTHKGVIFLLSIVCTSLGISLTNFKVKYTDINIIDLWDFILQEAYNLSKDYVSNEISKIHGYGLSQTYGQWAQSRYKLLGVRGIVTSNFQIVRCGLKIYLDLFNKIKNKELVLGQLRLYFLAYAEDTNIIKRAGIFNAYKLKDLAHKAYAAGGVFTKKGMLLVNMIEDLMNKNKWSAAASGDLIILILFMVSIYESRFINSRKKNFSS